MFWENTLAQMANARVAVIGDVMVDHYVYGAVQRISPEAPVPVLHVREERHTLGGAANVAAGVAALGGEVMLIGVIGDDPAGRELVRMLGAYPSVTVELASSRTHPTIIKTRYLGDRQQIVRVDREDRSAFSGEVLARIVRRIEDACGLCDVIVLSDYGKGLLSDDVLAAAFKSAREFNRTLIVDPKRARLADYRGATIITPNRKELEAAVGLSANTDAQAELAAGEAIDKTDAAILLTRSEKGMSLFRRDAPPVHLPTQAREVFDVSGAGDTVVATLATALAASVPIESAMALANAAAGVVVAKLGTAVCTRAELAAALHASNEAPSRAATWDEAAEMRERWRQQGLSVGFANGCFDLIHPGHVTLLQAAARQVDRLIVAINSDGSTARLKGPKRPVQTEQARAFVLAALKGVDLVTIFDQETPLDLIAKLVPDVLFKGADYREEDVVGGEIVKASGGRVVLIDLVEGQSTSKLVAKANEGE